MVNKLKLLIVEGNTKEENINFNNAGCIPQSQNFKLHIEKLEPNSEIDIVEPGNDNSILKIISSLKKYDGIVLTGSTLRIEDTTEEVKKHIEFTKTCFTYEKKFFVACNNCGIYRNYNWGVFNLLNDQQYSSSMK